MKSISAHFGARGITRSHFRNDSTAWKLDEFRTALRLVSFPFAMTIRHCRSMEDTGQPREGHDKPAAKGVKGLETA